MGTLTSDGVLVERIASGDRTAEQNLYERYWRWLVAILHKETRDSHLAQDLAQDAFIVVLKAARGGGINQPDAITSFLRNTARNLLIDYKRKTKRRATVIDTDIAERVRDDQRPYSARISEQQQKTLLIELLNELKERDKNVLRLRYLEDMSKLEVCCKLRMKPRDFDRIVSRARQKLKRLIDRKVASRDSSISAADFSPLLVVLILLPIVEPDVSKVREVSRMHHLQSGALDCGLRNFCNEDSGCESRCWPWR